MIIGIGTDLVEISRIKNVILRKKNKFIKYVLSNFEYKEYSISKFPVRFIAKRFAIKEATLKAFGIGLRNGISFKQLEIFHNYLGKPFLRFFEKSKNLLKELKINSVHITLSDTKKYVCSTVIFERN
ncbi:MAG: holo-ACP synthase [Enterobacteriaceae bacterium]